MLDSYEDIFTERGDAYHEAMTRWPDSRAEELRLLVDAPAGGGCLATCLTGLLVATGRKQG